MVGEADGTGGDDWDSMASCWVLCGELILDLGRFVGSISGGVEAESGVKLEVERLDPD